MGLGFDVALVSLKKERQNQKHETWARVFGFDARRYAIAAKLTGGRMNQFSLRNRVTLAIIGAIAGFVFWMLIEHVPDLVKNQRLIMLISAFAGNLFAALMLLIGPIPFRRAVLYSFGIAVLSAGFLFWASFRFDPVDGYFDSAYPFAAYLVLSWISLPFILTQENAPLWWRDYEGLFDHAWSNFVRTVTAWMFASLFWLVIFTSNMLLELVNFTYLGDLIDKAWFSMPLTGAIVGLALAVLNELSGVVTTLRSLALQLLRLLLPLVAFVIALFIVLVPFAGFEKVFGYFSAAGTMLAMAMGAVTLITSAVDAKNEDAVTYRLMVIAARVLCLLLPIITGIAVFAIWMRVAQYGWTPPRLAAFILALTMLFYALGYGVSALWRATWFSNIRVINTFMSLGILAISALWLSPVLNAERISANGQVTRFLAGTSKADDVDLKRLDKSWGLAGQAALDRLRKISTEPAHQALAAKISEYDVSRGASSSTTKDAKPEASQVRATLKKVLPVRPLDATPPKGMIDDLPELSARDLAKSCAKKLPDGRPGCVLVLGAFHVGDQSVSGVFFSRDRYGSGTAITTLVKRKGATFYMFGSQLQTLGEDLASRKPDNLISLILDGKFAFKPAKIQALEIDGAQIFPNQ